MTGLELRAQREKLEQLLEDILVRIHIVLIVGAKCLIAPCQVGMYDTVCC